MAPVTAVGAAQRATKAWEASRLRALNEVLGVELQPKELLLEAMEAPWGESDEVSSSEEEEGQASLHAEGGGPAPYQRG